jgi:transcriptional regulator with GAF, ATPase, and Fis domain
VSAAVGRQLEQYAWPGNVRELQNVIERAVLLSRGDALGLDGILTPAAQTSANPSKDAGREQPLDVIPEVEWRRREQANLRTALKLARGRIYGPDGAAEILGVKPTTLISRLKAVGLRDSTRSRDGSRTRR